MTHTKYNSMDIAYVKKVQEWVELDNILLKSKDDTRDVVDKRKVLEESILEYVEKNNFDNFDLTISDGKIKFAKKTNTQSLSTKTIKTLLTSYFAAPERANVVVDVDEICEYITSNLEKKTSIYMKRDIK